MPERTLKLTSLSNSFKKINKNGYSQTQTEKITASDEIVKAKEDNTTLLPVI